MAFFMENECENKCVFEQNMQRLNKIVLLLVKHVSLISLPFIKDFFKESKNRRIYDEGDVLYNTMGQFVPDNEVRPSVAEINPLLQPIPGAMAYNAWLAHRLSNFTGGTLKKKKNKY
jgi:hypothetical protein